MDALVSGQAAVAVLLEGEEAVLIKADALSKEVQFQQERISHLLRNAADTVVLKGTSKEDAGQYLISAWRRDRAMHLALILLDEQEDESIRIGAAEILDEFLKFDDVVQFVCNRLYSSPLPPVSDFDIPNNWKDLKASVRTFLTTLNNYQESIFKWRTAWDALSPKLFDISAPRSEVEKIAIKKGAFREFVIADNDAEMFDKALLNCYLALNSIPNGRKIVGEWTQDLRPQKSKKAPKFETEARRQVQDDDENGDEIYDDRSSYENYLAAQKQVEFIKGQMPRGNLAKVRKFVTQLVESQLRRGGEKYASKSLCALAQAAKDLYFYNFQLELAERATAIAPEDGWAYGQLADAQICLSYVDDALNSLALAEQYGEESFAAGGRGRILRLQGKLEEALVQYDFCIKKFGDDHDAWLYWGARAEILREMSSPDEAYEAYSEGIEQFPDKPMLYCGRAAVLADLGRLSESILAYSRILESFGDDVVALSGRAHVWHKMGELDKSLNAYSQTIKTFPNESVPQCGRAEVLKSFGRLGEALQAYESATQQFPYVVVAWNGRAESLRELGRLNEAVAAYDEAIRKFPFDVRSRGSRAYILRVKGDLEGALQAFDQNVKDFPYDLFCLQGRANILKELGHLDQAIEAYDQVIARNPREQSARYAKAAILVVKKQYVEAQKLLPTDEPQTLEDWIAYHIQCMILLKTGKTDEAIDALQWGIENIRFFKERIYFVNALAVAKIRLHQFADATAMLSNNETPIADVLRIHAYGEMGHQQDAATAYQRVQIDCPPNIVPLRDELAARYRLQLFRPTHSEQWLFDRECEGVILLAA